jgi:hypothetical protein
MKGSEMLAIYAASCHQRIATASIMIATTAQMKI